MCLPHFELALATALRCDDCRVENCAFHCGQRLCANLEVRAVPNRASNHTQHLVSAGSPSPAHCGAEQPPGSLETTAATSKKLACRIYHLQKAHSPSAEDAKILAARRSEIPMLGYARRASLLEPPASKLGTGVSGTHHAL